MQAKAALEHVVMCSLSCHVIIFRSVNMPFFPSSLSIIVFSFLTYDEKMTVLESTDSL